MAITVMINIGQSPKNRHGLPSTWQETKTFDGWMCVKPLLIWPKIYGIGTSNQSVPEMTIDLMGLIWFNMV